MSKNLYKYTIGILLLISLCTPVDSFCQEKIVYDSLMLARVQDTVDRYMRKHLRKFKPAQNKFKISPIIGFTYSEENKLGATTSINGHYRNSLDTLSAISKIILHTGISSNLSYFTKIEGIHHSPLEKFALDYSLNIFSDRRLFWGLGYNKTTVSNKESNFKLEGATLETAFLYNLTKNIRIGPTIGFDYYYAKDFSFSEYIEGEPLYSRAIKFGIRFNYDSRDRLISPETGSLIEFEQIFYPSLAFNKKAYYKTRLTSNFFLRGWQGSVFAFDLYADLNYGDTPWTLWPSMGGENRMRGYYHGRFRDRNYITAQLEIRQKIHRGHGIVVWVGGGNIFPELKTFNMRQTLPTYGAGYRYEFGGIILRADFGFGEPRNYAFIVAIDHSF